MLSRISSAFIAAVTLLMSSMLPAQAFPSAVVTPVAGNPQVMATGDFNRDGHADLVYLDAATGGNLHVLLGNGDGTFRTGQVMSVASTKAVIITVGDINGDGIPDLVLSAAMCSNNGLLSVLLGNGDGTFRSPLGVSGFPGACVGSHVGIADFDGDGVADLIYSDGSEYVYFLKGRGDGTFAAPVTINANNAFTGDVLVADFNGDGLPDFIVPTSYSFEVFLNQGGGHFAAPVFYKTNLYSTQANEVRLADLDRDGHLDVLYCIYGVLFAAYGHADGTFSLPVQVASVPNHVSAIPGVADLNGDLKPRVLISSPDGVTVALGATPGGSKTYAGTGYLSSQTVAADFNGDGFIDVAVPADNAIAILYGNADGTFAAAASVPTNVYVAGLAMVDTNGDHFPDAVLGSSLVFAGNGDGTFASVPIGGTLYAGADDPIFTGDFDADGLTDLFYSSAVSFNNGNGTFTYDYLGKYAADSFAAVADFNHDGKADIAIASSSSVTITLSGPARKFTYSQTALSEMTGPLGAGDFDGDGCPDLVAAGTNQLVILKGDCAGNLTPVRTYLTGFVSNGITAGTAGSNSPSDIAVGDFDGDGHLDIVYTIPGASLARVLYGRGDGTFVSGADLQLAHSSIFVTAGDLDNDGYADLVFDGHSLLTVMHGQQGRGFSVPEYLAAGFETGKPVLADLRRRGRLDIAVPNLGVEGTALNDSGYTFAILLNPLPPLSSSGLTTTLTITPEPSTYGTPFTAYATFKPVGNAAVPTGTAIFTLDGTSPTPGILGATGTTSATFTVASVGPHLVAVAYPGDTNFSTASATVTHVVLGLQTTPSFTCSPNPIFINATASLNATVSSSNGAPTGSITFTDNGTTLAQPSLVNGGTSLTYTGASAGTHTIVATYVPTGAYAATSASCSEVVNLNPSTSVLTVNPTSSTFGSPVTLTATVSPATLPGPGTPAGSVTFYNAGATLGTMSLNGSIATLITSSLPGGTDSLTCTYSGSTIYAASPCNTVPFNVAAAPSNLTLTPSANPATALTPITFTMHLSANGQPVGAGYAIQFTLNNQSLALTTDATGSATYTTSALTPGSYPVAANFLATSSLQASSASLDEVITTNPTTTSLAVSPNPGYQGRIITLIATVSAVGSQVPADKVTFYDGTSFIGTGSLDATSHATFTTTSLGIGTHPLTASYPSGTIYVGSTSPVVQEVILPSSFTLQLSPSTITLPPGQQGTVAVQLASVGVFAGPLSLTYGALPTYASASLSPATVTLTAGGTAVSSLALTTAARASNSIPRRPGSQDWPLIFTATLLLLAPLRISRRNRSLRLLGVLAAAFLSQTLTGCTNTYFIENVVSPGTYQVPVTATDANHNSQTGILTVVIHP